MQHEIYNFERRRRVGYKTVKNDKAVGIEENTGRMSRISCQRKVIRLTATTIGDNEE